MATAILLFLLVIVLLILLLCTLWVFGGKIMEDRIKKRNPGFIPKKKKR